jgi:hypothetical protein
LRRAPRAARRSGHLRKTWSKIRLTLAPIWPACAVWALVVQTAAAGSVLLLDQAVFGQGLLAGLADTLVGRLAGVGTALGRPVEPRIAPKLHGTQNMEQVLTAGSAGAGAATGAERLARTPRPARASNHTTARETRAKISWHAKHAACSRYTRPRPRTRPKIRHAKHPRRPAHAAAHSLPCLYRTALSPEQDISLHLTRFVADQSRRLR